MKPFRIFLFLACALFHFVASAELIRDVEYARPDGVSLKLDVNVPEGKGLFPIAILVHGGGFTNVDQRQYVTPLLLRSRTPSLPGSLSIIAACYRIHTPPGSKTWSNPSVG